PPPSAAAPPAPASAGSSGSPSGTWVPSPGAVSGSDSGSGFGSGASSCGEAGVPARGGTGCQPPSSCAMATPGMPPTAHAATMANMTATLTEIIEHKRQQIAAIMGDRSLADVRAEAEAAAGPASIRDFFSALAAADARPGPVAIIAEIKRRSPSAGQIRPEYAGESFAPERIARLYTEHGASAISCLTDEKFFGGHPDFIRRVKAATPLPVLRKDFLIDPRQVWESRALGADAILLIAECLPGDSLDAMADEAAAAGLAALIEIHEEANLERAAGLLGTPTVPGG